jgi:stage V sporulation protein SpoVS
MVRFTPDRFIHEEGTLGIQWIGALAVPQPVRHLAVTAKSLVRTGNPLTIPR